MATEPPIVRSAPRALRTPRSISDYLPYMPTFGRPKPALDPAAGLWSTGSMPQDQIYADQAPPEVFEPAVVAPPPAKAVDPVKAPAVAAAKQAAASAPGGANPSHMNDAAPPSRRRSPLPKAPWQHDTPMSDEDPWNPSGEAMTQGQLEGDYNAHEVINARHAQAMKAIKDAEAERGDPMEKKIRAEGLNAAYEDLMPVPDPEYSPFVVGEDSEGGKTVTSNEPPPMRRGQDMALANDKSRRMDQMRVEVMYRVRQAGEVLDAAIKKGDEKLIMAAQKAYDLISHEADQWLGKFPPKEGQQIQIGG